MTREHREYTVYERPEAGDHDVAFRRNLPDGEELLSPCITDEERAALVELATAPPVGIPWEHMASAPPDNTPILLLSPQGNVTQGNKLSPEYATATHWAPINLP